MRRKAPGRLFGAPGLSLGGDGGNRTRVRRFLYANLYKHSRPICSRRSPPGRRGNAIDQPLGLAPLGRRTWPACGATRRCCRSTATGRMAVCWERVQRLAGPLGFTLRAYAARGRAAKSVRLALIGFALILRARRLSACSSRSSTSVDTIHPRVLCAPYYNTCCNAYSHYILIFISFLLSHQ